MLEIMRSDAHTYLFILYIDDRELASCIYYRVYIYIYTNVLAQVIVKEREREG